MLKTNLFREKKFDSTWECKGSYWLNDAPQGTDEWKKNREQLLTMSKAGAALGKSKFCTPLEVARQVVGLEKEEFDERTQLVLQHGTQTEPVARQWYEANTKSQVKEVGLAVPVWETRIGASLDGEVVGTEGMIEIKCPLRMYGPLDSHKRKLDQGWKPDPFFHDHIWETHYIQMQGCMKVTNKKWCDYIVFATDSNRVYTERVFFNEKYWNDFLWPGITNFLDNVLGPLQKVFPDT